MNSKEKEKEMEKEHEDLRLFTIYTFIWNLTQTN